MHKPPSSSSRPPPLLVSLSSTLVLQRNRYWIKNVLTQQLYEEGLCSRVDLSVECGCSWEGDSQSTPFVWHFSSMTDGNYSHVVFHPSPCLPLISLSSTLVLLRERCWIKNVLTQQLYEEGLCSRVDLSVGCGHSWVGDGVTGYTRRVTGQFVLLSADSTPHEGCKVRWSCRLVEMCLDNRLVTLLVSKSDFVVPP